MTQFITRILTLAYLIVLAVLLYIVSLYIAYGQKHGYM